jgi:hypothetical protein
MAETLISAKMTAAGVNAPVTRLAAEADKALARNGGDVEKAFAGFSDVVWNDAALLRALFGDGTLNTWMRNYLIARESETAGAIRAVKASGPLAPPPHSSAQADATVQIIHESQWPFGRRDNSGDEPGGGVQVLHESHNVVGPAASPSQAGTILREHQLKMTPKPGRARTVQDIIDTGLFVCKLNDGTDLMREAVYETKKKFNHTWFDQAMRYQALRHCTTPDDKAIWQDLIKEDDMKTMQKLAAEFSDLVRKGFQITIEQFLEQRSMILEHADA